jgi:hypothetical protein
MADGPVQQPNAGVNLIVYEFGYKVPGLSFEPSELDPPLARECCSSPSLGPGGGTHSILTKGQTLGHSMYTVIPL